MTGSNAALQRQLSCFEPWPLRILVLVAASAIPVAGSVLLPWEGLARMVRWGFGYPAFLAFVGMGYGMAIVRWRQARWLSLALIIPFSCIVALLIWAKRLTVDELQGFWSFVDICGWLVKVCLAGLVGVAIAGWVAWWKVRRSETTGR